VVAVAAEEEWRHCYPLLVLVLAGHPAKPSHCATKRKDKLARRHCHGGMWEENAVKTRLTVCRDEAWDENC
jgi:hypothetical protein